MRGAITSYIDVAQVTLYVFWVFFAGLIFYLRREDKREGYPLVSDRAGGVIVQGLPFVPAPKVFRLGDGSTVLAPRPEPLQAVLARPAGTFLGAPLVPTGNPMVDGLGPAAYAFRSEEPDLMYGSELPRIVPLRADPEFFLAADDPDPRGMIVYGADRRPAGTVTECWIDRSEAIVRYLELTVATAGLPRSALLPMTMVRVDRRRRIVTVRAITAAQFADIPALHQPDLVTLREEDRIMAYFGGGTMYATSARAEPLL